MNEKQLRLAEPRVEYNYGPYDKCNDTEQWIRITEGCPNQCPYCYEPLKFQNFGIPEIRRKKVKIMDMNLICKPEALSIINRLGKSKAEFELICGIDYRFLTQEIADALHYNRFKRPRVAWDWSFSEQYKIKDAIGMLTKAGYRTKDIMVFMICNWKITFRENCRKLDLCKVWNVKVGDCYFDNQVSPNIQPIHWKPEDIKSFRRMARKHNQMVLFGIDPEVKP